MAFHTYVSGSTNIAYTFDPGGAFQLEEIRLHLAAAGGANSFTVTVDSHAGDAYDAVLNTQDLTAVTDEIYQPTRPQVFSNGDTLVFAWTNASSIQWGLEIVTR